MDAAVATEPIPKKRGRPKKVVSEDASAGELKTRVRKASTKATTTTAARKEAAPKKVAKPKVATKTATKTTVSKTAATKPTKVTKAAAPAKAPAEPKAQAVPEVAADVKPAPAKAPSTPKAPTSTVAASTAPAIPKTPTPPKAPAPATPSGASKVERHATETPHAADKPTPVTPSTSKILDEVYKTGTMKPPPTPTPAPAAQEIVLPTGGAANVVIEQPLPAATKPAMPSEPAPTPKYTPPTSSSARTPPPPPRAQLRSTSSPYSPLSASQKATTIPLPTHPTNPSKPAPLRPKPITVSAAEREKAAIERDIREGRMPSKYKGASRRVTSIIVGIPFIIVLGWELYKRWDNEVKTKYGSRNAVSVSQKTEGASKAD